jgi:hypothetical protein
MEQCHRSTGREHCRRRDDTKLQAHAVSLLGSGNGLNSARRPRTFAAQSNVAAKEAASPSGARSEKYTTLCTSFGLKSGSVGVHRAERQGALQRLQRRGERVRCLARPDALPVNV